MKRYLAMAAAVAMSLILAACASSSTTSGGDELTTSQWELTSWTGHEIPNGKGTDGGEPVVLNFKDDGKEASVSGRAWCNRFNAPYVLRDDGRLTIGHAAATRMACVGKAMEFESAFLDKLQALDRYSIKGKTLKLFAVDGEVMSLQARDKVSADAKVKFVYVAAEQVKCSAGVMQMMCLQVRERKEDPWQLWYSGIQGFTPMPDTEYRLRIVEERVANPPADASTIKWTLDLVVEQTAVAPKK